MAKLLKLRRGTTSQHSSFTGAEGEVTVDTTKDTLIVHDGSTAGGHAVAAEDMANVSSASIVGRLGTGSIVKAKLEADIIDGTKLADDAVNSEHYTDGSIDRVHLAADIIDDTKIADNSIKTEHYVDASIQHVHLQAEVIDGDNIQDDVINSEHIAAGAVDLEHMSSESVDEDNLKISNAGSNGQFLQKQSGNAGGLTWAAVDLSAYAPLAAPALTGTATGVNLTLSGNLTVNGTTTTVATTNTTVTDNLLELNSGAGSNANDAGILIERGSTGDNAIIAWDESADKFTVGTTTATNSATGNISITTGTIVANVEGNVTGNVTGNCSGSSSSCSGDAQTITITNGSANSTYYPVFAANNGSAKSLYIDGSASLSFNPSTDQLTCTTIHDSKGNLRSIPLQDESGGAYTLVASDAGQAVHCHSSTTAVTVNQSVFAAGDAVTIVNGGSSNMTITQGSSFSLRNSADASTGNRTLAQYGMATIWFSAHNIAFISGAGLS